ncbi:hypothetical protein ACFX10_032632 [Malus domestica]
MASLSDSSSHESLQHSTLNPLTKPNFSNSHTYLTIQNIGSMVPIKLKRSNYLSWCALFAPILRRYKPLDIVDGTEPCPLPFLLDRSINPDFEIWYEKDQNLLIWLNCTLSKDVIPFTVCVSSARDLWIKLEQGFGRVSDAHIHQLQSHLQAIQKGTQSMADYLQQLKEISYSLFAAGAPIYDRDLMAATLAGYLMNSNLSLILSCYIFLPRLWMNYMAFFSPRNFQCLAVRNSLLPILSFFRHFLLSLNHIFFQPHRLKLMLHNLNNLFYSTLIVEGLLIGVIIIIIMVGSIIIMVINKVFATLQLFLLQYSCSLSNLWIHQS